MLILHRSCIRISSSRRPVMCLFHVVLRRINVSNTSLMRLFSSLTRSVMCLFRPFYAAKKCHKRVLNVSLSLICPVIYCFRAILSRKYSLNTPVLWCYTPEIRVLLRDCTCFTFSTGLVMYLSYRLTSKILPKHTRYALQILLNTPILSWKYDRNSRVLLRKCIRFTS